MDHRVILSNHARERIAERFPDKSPLTDTIASNLVRVARHYQPYEEFKTLQQGVYFVCHKTQQFSIQKGKVIVITVHPRDDPKKRVHEELYEEFYTKYAEREQRVKRRVY